MALEYLQGGRLHRRWASAMLSHAHSREVLPNVHTEPLVFQSVPTASCPGIGNHQQEPGSILFTHTLQIFIPIDEILQAFFFSRLNNHRKQSAKAKDELGCYCSVDLLLLSGSKANVPFFPCCFSSLHIHTCPKVSCCHHSLLNTTHLESFHVTTRNALIWRSVQIE